MSDDKKTKADSLMWQSALHATVASASDGELRAFADTEIIETTGGDEMQLASVAGVCDLSPLPRSGGKGVCISSMPPVNQSVVLKEGGGICCRLAEDELFLLADDKNDSANIADIAGLFDGKYTNILRRDSHCQIGLCGERAAVVLSEVCALPPPLPGVVLQSRIAHVGAFIIGVQQQASPQKMNFSAPLASLQKMNFGAPQTSPQKMHFYLLADSGYAVHLWEEINHVAARVGGGMIGWQAWRNYQK